MVEHLKFDPTDLPHGAAPLPEGAEFIKWFTGIKQHHEFAEVEAHLVALARKAPAHIGQKLVEQSVLHEAWRAATWAADAYLEQYDTITDLRKRAPHVACLLLLLATDLQHAGEIGRAFTAASDVTAGAVRSWAAALQRGIDAVKSDVHTGAAQYGPFLWKGGIESKTHLPSAAAMLAAYLAVLLRPLGLFPGWTFLSKLAAVAGLSDVPEPESLRVSAGRLIERVESGDVAAVGWPQDTGTTLESLRAHLAATGP